MKREQGIRALRRHGQGLAIALSFALIAACASPVGPQDERDGAAGAPTFVSLDPCLDAILVEVADASQILALSHYSLDPAASSIDLRIAERFGATAGTAEEIIALQPDLVIASTFIAPATQSALERAGLAVETFGGASSSEASVRQIRRIASLASREERGQRLVDRIVSEIERPSGRAGTALLWQPGQIVAGEASLVAEHLSWAGFTNQASAKGLGQAEFVSLENLVADPPDLLLVAGDARGQSHPVLGALDDTHTARFDPNLFYCAGPSIIRARQRLVEIRSAMAEAP